MEKSQQKMFDERPSTSRPKTSLGNRPPSAIHNLQSDRVSSVIRPRTGVGRQRSQEGLPGTGLSKTFASKTVLTTRGHLDTKDRVQSRAQSRIGSAMGQSGQEGRPLRTPSIQVRPVTQQGLVGVRGNRQVLDKSYYMGLLRAKINMLCKEINTLNKDLNRGNEDRHNYIIYEKRAEDAALKIKGLQGKLTDLNLLVDRMNTNSDMNELKNEVNQLKIWNGQITEEVDGLFAERRAKDEKVKTIELELNTEKRKNENLVNGMDPELRQNYDELKRQSEQLTEDVRLKQQELEQLVQKKSDLEDELAVSPFKQEALVLHERLAELICRKEAILEEINAEGTIEEQRDRLLQKVRKHTEEIGTMQRQIDELSEKSNMYQEELRELEEEFEDQAGEKNEKYRELRHKEKQINDFLDTFTLNRIEEQHRLDLLQRNIVDLLGDISRNWVQFDKTAIATGMDDYNLKSIVDEHIEANTVPELQNQHLQLQEEMIRVTEMDEKAGKELEILRSKLPEMQMELKVFGDLQTLKESAENKRDHLQTEREQLEESVGEARNRENQLHNEISQLRMKLDENDLYLQVLNLEKKLQYVEQNNYALRDTIETNLVRTNFGPVKEQALEMLSEYNTILVTMITGRSTSSATNRAAI